MMSKEAMKLALEALEEPHPGIRTSFTDAVTYREKVKQAITALQEALAEQPAQQEPVAQYIGESSEGSLVQLYDDVKKGTNLYTSPPAQRKPLAKQERDLIHAATGSMTFFKAVEYAITQTEAAHNIKEQP